MDVIPHACSIGSGLVTAKHLQCWSVANGHLAHKGEQVVGNTTGILTDAARGMGAYGVDITQSSDPPAVRFTPFQVGQHLFHRCLGVAVVIDRCNWCGLGDGNGVGIAAEGGAAAEHQGVAVMDIHRLK